MSEPDAPYAPPNSATDFAQTSQRDTQPLTWPEQPHERRAGRRAQACASCRASKIGCSLTTTWSKQGCTRCMSKSQPCLDPRNLEKVVSDDLPMGSSKPQKEEAEEQWLWFRPTSRKVKLACTSCRKRKAKCSLVTTEGEGSCQGCRTRQEDCLPWISNKEPKPEAKRPPTDSGGGAGSLTPQTFELAEKSPGGSSEPSVTREEQARTGDDASTGMAPQSPNVAETSLTSRSSTTQPDGTHHGIRSSSPPRPQEANEEDAAEDWPKLDCPPLVGDLSCDGAYRPGLADWDPADLFSGSTAGHE